MFFSHLARMSTLSSSWHGWSIRFEHSVIAKWLETMVHSLSYSTWKAVAIKFSLPFKKRSSLVGSPFVVLNSSAIALKRRTLTSSTSPLTWMRQVERFDSSKILSMKLESVNWDCEQAENIWQPVCCIWKEFLVSCDSVWPDLAKFRHFGKILKVFGQFLKSWFPSWQNVEPIWQRFYAFGQSYIVTNGQILNNNPAIWSHCVWNELYSMQWEVG